MIFKAIKKGIKKLARGVKKVVKKIGSGIKSAVKKVGKFMGKIGIVGQIAMSFILPGIGGALMKGVGSAFSGAVGSMLGSKSLLIRGAGHVLKAAGNFAKAGHSAFKTVTGAVGSFVKEFAGTALKQIPGMEKLMPSLENSSDSFFGKDSAFSRVQDNIAQNGSKFVEAFDKAIGKDVAVTGTGPTTAKVVNVADKTVGTESLVDTLSTDSKLPVSSEVTTSLLEPQAGGINQEALQASLQGSDGSMVSDMMSGNVVDPSAPIDMTKRLQASLQGSDGSMVKDMMSKKASDPSFLSKLGTSTKEAFMSIPEKIIEAPGKFVEGLDNTVQKGLQNKVLVETGLKKEPVYTTVYEGSTVIPDMSSTPFMAQYGSPEINDRAYQMSIDPSGFAMTNPWGSPANSYQQELGARYG